jgi:gas vesicle protein
MSNNRFFEGLIFGGTLGFVFGILFAPKAGSELRKQISDGSDDLYKQASTSMSDLKDRTEQAITDLQHKGENAIKQASVQVQETKDQLMHKLQDISGNRPKGSNSNSGSNPNNTIHTT